MSERQEKEEKEERRRYPSIFWPALLITAGVIFLLDNLGYVDVDWTDLWRFWPVVLILAGLDLLLARRSALGNLIVLVLTLALIGGVVWMVVGGGGLLLGSDDRGGAGVTRIDEPLDDAERAALDVAFASGTLDIAAAAERGSLVQGDLDLATDHNPVWDVERSGQEVTMRLAYPRGTSVSFAFGQGDDWQLRLSPQAGWDLMVDVGAGDARLDLTGLDVRALTVNTGAGQTTVILPDQGDFEATVEGGVGTLTLEIPATMAARVTVNGGLAPVSASDRYDKEGRTYTAGNWDTADERVEIRLNLGIGAVTIREP